LAKHNGSLEAVVATPARLDPAGNWLMLRIETCAAMDRQETEKAREELKWVTMVSLAQAVQNEDLSTAVTEILQAAQKLTGAELLGMYHSMPDMPGFRLYDSLPDPSNLPTELLPADFYTFRDPAVWTQKKHAATPIHLAVRSAGMNYLVSRPLGGKPGLSGLVIFAGREEAPPSDLSLLAELIANALTTVLETSIKAGNLENRLLEAQKELAIGEMVQESVRAGIVLLEPDLRIVELNTFAEMTLGYPTNEVRGEQVQNVVIGTNSLTAALRQAQQGIPTFDLGNVHLHNREGQSFLAHIQILPIQVNEITDKIVVLIHDQSEHERFRVRTQQLEHRALLGEVMAIFAHEVRNPINNIASGLQMMAHNLPEDDLNQDRIDKLLHDSLRLDHLMKAVLDFSRSSEINLEPLDLSTLVKRFLDRWQPRFRKVNVQSHLQVDPATPQVMGDQRALEQVLTNLVSNAVQAMTGMGGTLAVKLNPGVSVDGMPNKVEISVSDTGPGIPEEHLERIYEPFFTTHSQGTGLGLAITKRIVYAHRGMIDVQSFPGGTMFKITLPAAGE
jgi:signal transduction histidine kinase